MKYNRDIVEQVLIQELGQQPIFEYRFCPDRKWRFDIYFEKAKLAIEIQGGLWIKYGGGRHQRGATMLKEWEKLNTAASMGIRVMYVQPQDLLMQDFLSLVMVALSQGSRG